MFWSIVPNFINTSVNITLSNPSQWIFTAVVIPAAYSMVFLSGYIVARIFIEDLKRAGPEVDKESIIDAILSIKDLEIGIGTPISYTNDNYQGSQMVWPTVIRNGHFESFDFSSLKK